MKRVDRFQVGDWVRRKVGGMPTGPILVVQGFMGWGRAGKWMMGDHPEIVTRGTVVLSDGRFEDADNLWERGVEEEEERGKRQAEYMLEEAERQRRLYEKMMRNKEEIMEQMAIPGKFWGMG